MGENLSLFTDASMKEAPLADRLRPQIWEEYQGLSQLDPHLVAQLTAGTGTPPSLVLWGPPGCGKTTFARLLGASFDVDFVEFSAVLGGVKEVREIVKRAQQSSRRTVLFVDEIHRFNKAQQDAFLPHIENGTLILIGATTENPSFSLNNALLSRLRVLRLDAVAYEGLDAIVGRAEAHCGFRFDEEARKRLLAACGGDARKLCNIIEGLEQTLPDNTEVLTDEFLCAALKKADHFQYDRAGDAHYDTISAFIKSMRGSDPDAALYWGFRMLESGEDPRFLLRRMIIFASEDIGNADPRALGLAVSTMQAYECIGLPEGRIPLAQCITYLASAPKSNRSYQAMHAAVDAVQRHRFEAVPLHLRNSPTSLMKEMDYGKEYVYPHDTAEGFAPGVEYLPERLQGQQFYHPSPRGAEKTIGDRLQYWRRLTKESKQHE